MKHLIGNACTFKTNSKFVKIFLLEGIEEAGNGYNLKVTVLKRDRISATLIKDYETTIKVTDEYKRVDCDGYVLEGKLCKYQSMSLKQGTIGSTWR